MKWTPPTPPPTFEAAIDEMTKLGRVEICTSDGRNYKGFVLAFRPDGDYVNLYADNREVYIRISAILSVRLESSAEGEEVEGACL